MSCVVFFLLQQCPEEGCCCNCVPCCRVLRLPWLQVPVLMLPCGAAAMSGVLPGAGVATCYSCTVLQGYMPTGMSRLPLPVCSHVGTLGLLQPQLETQ